ncbi:MAG: type II toxin-antitoxin system VapC family toxin [Candidatus Methylumidiphilus sp.]
MKSVDTNVLVRYYAQDDPNQSNAATKILATEPDLFVSKTVLIEFWWVLTRAEKFSFPLDKVVAVIEHLIGLPNISIEDDAAVLKALSWCHLGLEFPDALHLSSSSRCETMLTFDDRKFARRANRLGLHPPCYVPVS